MSAQRSPEWFAERLGKVTASKVADVVSKTKSGWSSGRANYAAQLIAERLTGVTAATFENDAMRWGNEQEGPARDFYAFLQDVDVELVGFVPHPRVEMSGASPDGLIGAAGLLELKCPNTATHIDTLLGEPFPSKYILQVQWQLACTGRDWADLCSFDPRLPADMRLHVERVERDEPTIATLEREVSLFLREIDTKLASLRGRLPKAAA